ncbi:MAG: hypothetical protein LC792_02535 [Actinobacteria bacterium]|nr:hypothetical protein [Actinomycetota bacterium]
MRRLLVGGSLCLAVGLAFAIKGLVDGDWGRVGFGGFGVVMGTGSLLSFWIQREDLNR